MPDIPNILRDAEWLTRLARSLTADADDAVQDTFAAARRSRPDLGRPVRPRLRRLAANIVRMRDRARIRRDAREAPIDQVTEPTPTRAQLLARVRIECTLADLVLALEEPYRSTILLRYRAGVTAETIAQQQGVPVGTVRCRLRTGANRLRTRLDEGESSKTWRAACAPFPAMRTMHPRWTLVMAKTTTKTSIAVVVLLVLAIGGGALVWKTRRGHSHDNTATGCLTRAQPVVVR